MSHSPGPWRWYPTDRGCVVGPGNGAWFVENIGEADATLIAAAPELLRLVKALVAAPTTADLEEPRTLIARIEGGKEPDSST